MMKMSVVDSIYLNVVVTYAYHNSIHFKFYYYHVYLGRNGCTVTCFALPYSVTTFWTIVIHIKLHTVPNGQKNNVFCHLFL